jgi:hypothetical protein
MEFPAHGVVNETTKMAYQGAVHVSAFLIDPSASNFGSIMPGDLRGFTTSNQETGLRSFRDAGR